MKQKKNYKKKAICIIVCACLVVSLLSSAVFAVDMGQENQMAVAPIESDYTVENVTTVGGSDGKILGVDESLEYSIDKEEWNAIEGTEITDLSAGEVYLRFKATDDLAASEYITLTVSEPEDIEGTEKEDVMKSTPMPMNLKSEPLTLSGLFTGKFSAGTQIFDCQRKARKENNTIVGYDVSSFVRPYATKKPYIPSDGVRAVRSQFTESQLVGKYFMFKYLPSKTTDESKPVVGLYLYNSDGSPAQVSGKTDEDGFVNMGRVVFISDEGILYISGVSSSDHYGDLGYFISNGAGYAYSGSEELRLNPINNPTLEQLKEYETGTILFENNEYGIYYNSNTTGAVSNMPSEQRATKDVETTLSAQKPFWTGHTFLGWSLTPEKAGKLYQPGEAYAGNSKKTFYAIWETSEAPPVTIKDASVYGGYGSIVSTTENMEYSLKGGNSWTTCNNTSTLVKAGEYEVRYKAETGTYPPDTAEVTVKQAAPILQPSISNPAYQESDGKITNLPTSGVTIIYQINWGKEHTLQDGQVTSLKGGDVVTMYVKEDTLTNASDLYTREIRQVAPELNPVIVNPTYNRANGSFGSLPTDVSIQYSTDKINWNTVVDGKILSLSVDDYYLRVIQSDTTLAGDTKTIRLKQLAPTLAPTLTNATFQNSDGKLEGFLGDLTIKYSTDNKQTWKTVNGTTITGLSAGKVFLQVAETDTTLAGDFMDTIVYQDAPELNPTVDTTPTFGKSDGVLTGLPSGANTYYSTNGITWEKVNGTTITGLAAGTLKLKVYEDQATYTVAGSVKNVVIKQKAPVLEPKHTDATAYGEDDGEITDLPSGATMEYSTDGATWNEVSGTTIIGLSAGEVSIRVVEDDNTLASTSITKVTVTEPAPTINPTVKDVTVYGGADGEITGLPERVDMEYSFDGEEWNAVTNSALNELPAGKVMFRTLRTGFTNPSEDVTTVMVMQAAPELNPDKSNVTKHQGTDGEIKGLPTDVNLEYSTDEGKTWIEVTGDVITGLPAGIVQIRVIGDDAGITLASEPIAVNVLQPAATPSKVAAVPTSIKDGKVIGVNETMEYSTDGGKTWLPVTGTEISELPVGSVLIRVAESDTALASEPVLLNIEALNPATGDTNSMLTWVMLLMISLCSLTLMVILRYIRYDE